MKFSIIIPVYNAEKTLNESLESIQCQSFKDFEIVFVNDCSTDGSVEILEDFSNTSGLRCKIIHQDKNGGVALARNRGLEVAEGEYVMWLDADDAVAPDALSSIADAIQDGPDIVGWDWTLGFSQNGRYMRQRDYDSPLQALKNLMGGTMRWNLWLFAIKRELIEANSIRFIAGANMGEDMMFMLRAFACAESVMQIHESFYNYNAVSTSSISRQFSEERRREVSENMAVAIEAIKTSEYAMDLEPYENHLKLFVKLPLLMSCDKENYKIWHEWWPEANAFAMANKELPFRTRFVQWMAAKKFWFGVKSYYVLVYKFVYGLIYR